VPGNAKQLNKVSAFMVGDYQVEPSALRVVGNEKVSRLEPRTMQLLVYFACHAGRVISRSELEEHVWEGRIVGEDALTNSISKLRRTLGDNARHPRIIETVPKTGYRLIASVRWLDSQLPDDPAAGAVNRTTQPTKRQLLLWGVAVALLVIVIAGWLFDRLRAPVSQTPVTDMTSAIKPSVAIIPFENLGDKSQDYFTNGITTNLITDLSKISGMTVIAQGSVFAYLNSDAETSQISSELNAHYVVKGAVQRQQDRVRVNVQLIEAETERTLWAEKYEGEMRDVFRFQDRIANALVSELRIRLAPGESEIFSRYPTTDVAAYDLFLRGQQQYGHRTRESNRSAREYFEQAIALDPEFARATASLALVHSRDAFDGWTDSPERSLARADEFAEAAARINPTIPQIHFVAGQVALFREQHANAIAAAERAIEYAPNYADGYAFLAWALNYAGRQAEAEKALQIAMRLNPISPASYYETKGEILYIQGYYAKAIDAFNTSLQINPSHMRARMWLIATLVQLQKPEETQWQVDELLLSHPGFSLSRLDHAFPFQDASIRQQLMQNLKRAGLPD
jgi:adenylate cyclase